MTFICSNLIDFQYLALLILAIVLTRIHFRFYLGCNVSIFPLVLHEQCRNRNVFCCVLIKLSVSSPSFLTSIIFDIYIISLVKWFVNMSHQNILMCFFLPLVCQRQKKEKDKINRESTAF